MKNFRAFITILLLSVLSFAKEQEKEIVDILDQKLSEECPPKETPPPQEKFFTFDYKDTPLPQVINELAALKNFNVLLPQGTEELKIKINYTNKEKMTLDAAWHELNKIIYLSGYTWLAEQNNQLQLIKTQAQKKDEDDVQQGNAAKREYLPLFINPHLENIPDTGEEITIIFYLSNLKLYSDKDKKAVTAILKGASGQEGMLSATANLKIVDNENALVIVDKANVIKSAMKIIIALDTAGIPDAIEVIPLYYTQAQDVVSLFEGLIPKTPAAPTTFGPQRASAKKEAIYFPENTKVEALDRTNSIVIMGSIRSIRIVKDFIIKYIDHPLESGKSILHIYDLQYLKAETFQGVLSKLVTGGAAAGESGGQAEGKEVKGPRRDFQDVIIFAEPTVQSTKSNEALTPGQSAAISGTGDFGSITPETEGVHQGGNRLIIAAHHHDWTRINALIEKLDKPQPQVALEVLVVDLTVNRNKILGSQIRNPENFSDPFNGNINFQSNLLGPPILTQNENGTFPANALMANLLQLTGGDDGSGGSNIGTNATNGSTIISIRDTIAGNPIWNVWQILNRFANVTLLAQPFITSLDNHQASITIAADRYLVGGPAAESGAVNIKNEYVTAETTIDLLPQISLNRGNINLNVVITVNEYQDAADTGNNTRITRLVQTDANIGNGEVLAIGGLVREAETTATRETPLLGKVPVLGWFFKRKEKVRVKTNLMVFIAPTIIQPRTEGGLGPYSESKLCYAEQELEGSVNFQNLRDPITRWFFQPDPGYGRRIAEDYVEQKVFDESPDHPITMISNEQKPVGSDTEVNYPITLAKTSIDKEYALKQLINNENNPLIGIQKAKDKIVLNT